MNGRPDADSYPLGFMSFQADVFMDVHNSQIATQAVLQHRAIHSLFSKDAAKDFKKQIETLTNG